MKFPFLNKNKKHLVVLIDIGSHSIGAAYALVTKSEAPFILASVRKSLDGSMDNASTIMRSLSTSLSKTLDILVKDKSSIVFSVLGHVRVDHIFVSLASPWQRTKTYTHRVSSPKEFSVSGKHIDEAILKAKESLGTETKHVSVDSVVIDATANGYKIKNPIGKKVNELSLTILESLVPDDLIKVIGDEVFSKFNQRDIYYQNFPALSYIVMRDIFSSEDDFVMVDITGIATDISVVYDGVFTKTISAGKGATSIKPAPNNSFDVLQVTEGIKQALSEVATEHPLPQTLFLLCDMSYRKDMVKALQNIDLYNVRLGSKPLSIIALSDNSLKSHVVYGAGESHDIFLSIMALFFGKRFLFPDYDII